MKTDRLSYDTPERIIYHAAIPQKSSTQELLWIFLHRTVSNKSSEPFIHALLNLTKQRGLCRVIMTRHSLTTSVNVNRWRRLLTPAGAG